MESNRMFDKASFTELKSVAEVKAAVSYLAHNEVKFRNELVAEGLSYENVQSELAYMWKTLLSQCAQYGYDDYIVRSKKKIYSV